MRIPQPFYRAALACWYLKLGKTFHRLGKGPKDAPPPEVMTKYHEIMANRQPAATAADGTVASIIAQYLAWCARQCELGEMKSLTHRWYKRFLDSFVAYLNRVHPGLTIAELKTHHVKDWRDEEYGKPAGKRGAVVSVKRALNWAADDREIIPANPVKKIKAGKQPSREVYITAEQWGRILAAVDDSDPFKEILLIMHATGCRPGEARSVECRHVDLARRIWEFPPDEWKCGKKTGKKRVIYLNGDAFDLTRRAVLRAGGDGYLFRNRKGKPFTSAWIGSKCSRLGEKLKLVGFCAYALRHTWTTDKLKQGVDPCTVAKLAGNSPEMVMEVYNQLGLNESHLHDAARAGDPPAGKREAS